MGLGAKPEAACACSANSALSLRGRDGGRSLFCGRQWISANGIGSLEARDAATARGSMVERLSAHFPMQLE
jgi:hypothetical protein